ncbi:MAG TPA: hypothetical protein VET23_08695 [Chitinophagaceae bacterium]|nr:hypothetical protein [Chitinophagaceae bacterium]
MAELSLWLDYYDDLYSDFDSRYYLKRRVSKDFLYELRNALKYKKERVTDLLLLLPQEKRDEPNEKAIAGSLRDFFATQYRIHSDKCHRKINNVITLGITGILVMVINSYIGFKGTHTLTLVALRVLLEPAGWFLLWASFDFLFYSLKELKKDREFFRELSEMNIHFKSS